MAPLFTAWSLVAAGSGVAWAQMATPAPKRGATVPFITYEAESPLNQTNGKVVRMAGVPEARTATPELEASGRAFVELSKPDDFLNIRAVQPANTIVMRHCIPDAPAGSGMEASLTLLVNGTVRQTLRLNSKHAWLYGEAGKNGQSNDPAAGTPHVFWDEARFFLAGGVRAGDTLRLQKGKGDTAAFYRIDLIDLELVAAAPAAPAPDGFLSVADFGARGDDTLDDTKALADCIAAAKAQGKGVWIPAGRYYQKEKLALDGVKVRGAGPWHTEIAGTEAGTSWTGNVGFDLKGTGAEVTDLFIESAAHTSRSTGGKPFTGAGDKWRIENVWVTHTNTGIWMKGTNGVVRNCRIRSTYADGINLNSGATGNLVENNSVRGTGDDGIALLSETEKNNPVSQKNVVRFNTVSSVWWGHNCDLAGGNGHLIEDNVLADNARFGCFTINLPSAYPMFPLKDAVVRRNSIIRGGGNFEGQKRGAVWIYTGSTTAQNVTVQENDISDAIFRGIHLAGGKEQGLSFDRNIIENPGEAGVFVEPMVNGSAAFTGNRVLKPGRGVTPWVNESKALSVSLKQNSWR